MDNCLGGGLSSNELEAVVSLDMKACFAGGLKRNVCLAGDLKTNWLTAVCGLTRMGCLAGGLNSNWLEVVACTGLKRHFLLVA